MLFPSISKTCGETGRFAVLCTAQEMVKQDFQLLFALCRLPAGHFVGNNESLHEQNGRDSHQGGLQVFPRSLSPQCNATAVRKILAPHRHVFCRSVHLKLSLILQKLSSLQVYSRIATRLPPDGQARWKWRVLTDILSL